MAFSPLSGGVVGPAGLQLVDEVLTTVAKQFKPHGYIYDQLVAPQDVNYNHGLYPIFDPAAFFTTGGNLAVADGAPTPLIDFAYSTDTYNCIDYRLAAKVTRKELEQAHDALRLAYSKTVGLLTVFATNREKRLADKLRSTGNNGKFTASAVTPSVKWDAGTSSTPATIQNDITSAALTVMKASGIRPNTIVMDYQIANAIAQDYTVKQQLQYRVGPEQIAQGTGILPPTLFGFKVVVADGTLFNTARPNATAALTSAWGNSVRLLYVDPNAGWGQPSTVYSFRGRVSSSGNDAQPPTTILPSGQTGQEPGPASGGHAVVDRWWEMDPPAERIRVWECVDEKVVAPELGVEIASVLNAPVY